MRTLQALLEVCEPTQDAVTAVICKTDPAFKPSLPGLTKLMSRFSRAGEWHKSLYIFNSLHDLGLAPDTMITNAAIAACDRGGAWDRAQDIFDQMASQDLARDAITYCTVISALSKSKQWQLPLQMFMHMCQEGVAADAVTCCTLISAMDKASKWQLAESIFLCIYRDHPAFCGMLESITPDQSGLSAEEVDMMESLRCHLAPKMLSAQHLHQDGSQMQASQHLLGDGVSRPHSPPDSTASMETLASQLMNFHVSPAVRQNRKSRSHPGWASPMGERMGSVSPRLPPGICPRTSLSSQADSSPTASGSHMDFVTGNFVPMRSLAGMVASQDSVSMPLAMHNQPLPGFGAGHSAEPALKHAHSGMSVTSHGSGGGASRGGKGRRKDLSIRVCCNALLSAYAHAEPPQCSRSLELVRVMLSAGSEVSPDILSFNALIKAYANAGQHQEAFLVYDLLLKQDVTPTPATFRTLMRCAVDGGMHSSVQTLWHDMQAHGVKPSSSCVDAYVHSLIKQGRLEGAMHQYSSMLMRTPGCVPNTETINTLMTELIAQGKAEAAIKVSQIVSDLAAESPFNCQSTNLLLQAYGQLGQWREGHEALLLAVEENRADSRSVLLHLQQLLEVSRVAASISDANTQYSALALHWKAVDMSLRGSLAMSSDCFEVASAVCAVSPCTDLNAQLAEATVVDLCVRSMERGVPLTRGCITHAVCACMTSDIHDSRHRLLSKALPMLRSSQQKSASHAAVLIALACVLHDLDAVREVIATMPDAPGESLQEVAEATMFESQHDAARHDVLDTCGAPLAEALRMAALALLDLGRTNFSVDILQGVVTGVRSQNGDQNVALLLDALNSAKLALLSDDLFYAARSDGDVADVVSSQLSKRESSPFMVDLLPTVVLTLRRINPDNVGTVLHAVLKLVLQSSPLKVQKLCVLLAMLAGAGHLSFATDILTRFLLHSSPMRHAQVLNSAAHTTALSHTLSHIVAVHLAHGQLRAGVALLLIGHRSRIAALWQAPSPDVQRRASAALNAPDAQVAQSVNVACDTPSSTVAMMYAWIVDLMLSPCMEATDSLTAIQLQRAGGDDSLGAAGRLPFVLASLGCTDALSEVAESGGLPFSLFQLASCPPFMLDSSALYIRIQDLYHWLGRVQEQGLLDGLLAFCRRALDGNVEAPDRHLFRLPI